MNGGGSIMAIGSRRIRIWLVSMALSGSVLATVPAAAQDDGSEARLRKIEAEVRALQRQVFPGGDGRFFTPEIDTSQGQPSNVPGTPATTPLTDVLGRLDAIEAQLTSLTSQIEINTQRTQNQHQRISALEQAAAQQAAAQQAAAEQAAAEQAAQAPEPEPTQPQAAPTPERVAAVQAIEKPSSDDKGDDEYVYGFRLWDAGFFPEAQQQLQMFVQDYPNHWRTSWGRNLLGRAYLDNNQPRIAANWFLQNYQADRAAERAPDSLLFLAEAMIQVNDTNRACIALAEFSENYPAVASGRLQVQFEANRTKVTCN
jgi:TolA-binding protein